MPTTRRRCLYHLCSFPLSLLHLIVKMPLSIQFIDSMLPHTEYLSVITASNVLAGRFANEDYMTYFDRPLTCSRMQRNAIAACYLDDVY
jgi:hypothetical protein